MNRSDAIILTATLLGLGLTLFGVFAFRRRWRVRAAFTVVFSMPILLFGGNAVPALSFVPQWMKAGPFRTAVCDDGPGLVARHDVDPATGADPEGDLCATALMINLPTASVRPVTDLSPCWGAIDPAAVTDETCYSFATLEFDDGGKLLDRRQLQQLDRHIEKLSVALGERYRASLHGSNVDAKRKADKPGIYMLAFVHGWRHNGERGDENVRQFRLMVANASRDVAARCAQEQRHCNTAVVGVFVGWRGSAGMFDYEDPISNIPISTLESGNAKPSWLAKVAGAFNGLTFPSRKLVSDNIGRPVLAKLGDVRRTIESKFPGGTSHFLLIGHSLGGNMLLSATPLDRLTTPSLGLPFDLTVLINPATETAKWRQRAAIIVEHSWGSRVALRLIALVSPPSYIDPESLRDLQNRPPSQKQKERYEERKASVEEQYDTVVDRYFTVSQLVMHGGPRNCTDVENLFGLGHIMYREQKVKRDWWDWILPETSLCEDKHVSFLTHFVEVNRQPNTRLSWLSYRNARSPAHSCFFEKSFLYCARARQSEFGKVCGEMEESRQSGSWDFATLAAEHITLGRTRDLKLNEHVAIPASVSEAPDDCRSKGKGRERIVASRQQINVQFASGFAPGERSQHPEKFSPIWGARVLPQSLVDHSGFWTEPFACMFNKLVLDEPLAKPDKHDPHGIYAPLQPVPRKQFKMTLLRKCAELIPI